MLKNISEKKIFQKKNEASHEYCADAIALYDGKIVLVERLNFPQGYALPGGRRDPLQKIDSKKIFQESDFETPEVCAIREFFEETGLTLIIRGVLGVYDAPNRDPRGPKTSTVVYGTASGILRDEIGKTRVFFMDPFDMEKNKEKFVFDHYKILCDARKKGILP